MCHDLSSPMLNYIICHLQIIFYLGQTMWESVGNYSPGKVKQFFEIIYNVITSIEWQGFQLK